MDVIKSVKGRNENEKEKMILVFVQSKFNDAG